MDDLLKLQSGVGRGQENGEDDVFATDNALREIGAYTPPPEYAHEPGPLLALSRAEHRGAAASLHAKMQEFFRNHPTYKTLAFGSTKRGEKIVAETHFNFRRAGLDAFYRTLRKFPIAYEREAFEAWQKIFPEIRKYSQY